MVTETTPPAIHLGRKIMQMRELLRITQDTVAEKMGISQQSVSRIEQTEDVDDDTLERAARALGVSAEAIKNLDEQATVYNIVTNQGHSQMVGAHNYNHSCTFNPFDKWTEALKKNDQLYEALLASEREKVAMLQKFLDEKK